MKLVLFLSLLFVLERISAFGIDINKYTPEKLADFRGKEINEFLRDAGEDYNAYSFITDPPGKIQGCAFIYIDQEKNIGYRFEIYIASTDFIKQVFSEKFEWDLEEVKKERIGYITIRTFVREKDYIWNEEVEQFLMDSFFEPDFYFPGRPLNINGRKIYFIFHLIDNNDQYVFDYAVAYSFFDGKLRGLLTIKDFCIINSNNAVLFDFSKNHAGIYGFKISQFSPMPEVDEYTPELTMDIYFDQGERIGDSFKITWNEDKGTFEKNERPMEQDFRELVRVGLYINEDYKDEQLPIEIKKSKDYLLSRGYIQTKKNPNFFIEEIYNMAYDHINKGYLLCQKRI